MQRIILLFRKGINKRFLINYLIQRALLLFFLLIAMRCAVMHSSVSENFKIQRAWYQTWVVGPEEKGTNVYIEIVNCKEGVRFDSICFRGMYLNLTQKLSGDTTLLISVLSTENKRLEMAANTAKPNVPNTLYYQFDGKSSVFLLPEFERRETKFSVIK